ncbi:hypothetical protein Q9233_016826 [Columba guinea]|nr:hypothetical protein Q9233_016826 [Columba guinea]
MARLTHSTRHRLFHNLVRQDLAFLQATPAAELCARLGTDVPLLCRTVPLSVNVALRSLLKVLGLGGFMVGLSPRLALLAAVEAPLVVAARWVYDARQQVLQRALLDATAATAATVQEAVSAIETVRSFAGEEEEERRHGRAVAEMLRLKSQIDTERALFTLVQRVLQLAVQVLVLWHGRRLLGEGTVTAGSLVTFLLYQARVGREVQDVSFELHPGEVTALAGLNGSGKSTCAALLARLYEPDAGEVLLDGAPLREYQHGYLHRQVGHAMPSHAIPYHPLPSHTIPYHPMPSHAIPCHPIPSHAMPY